MKNLVVAFILILLAGASAVFVTSRGEQGETATTSGTSPLDEDYDYYVQDMRTTRFNGAGQPVSELRAERVTHFPDGDRAEMQMPAFKSFGVDNAAWQVNANAGTLAPDAERAEDRLDLQGEVQLYKPLASGDFADVRTTALTVFTDSEEASSEAPVVLEMRGTHMEGVGMHARLAENSIQLNDSKGSHDPATRP